jgi:hypothetical protein
VRRLSLETCLRLVEVILLGWGLVLGLLAAVEEEQRKDFGV